MTSASRISHFTLAIKTTITINLFLKELYQTL